MKRVFLTVGLSGILALAGCGGGSKGFAPPTIVMGQKVIWIDGDPRVPFCTAVKTNCQDHYTIHDKTTDVFIDLPISALTFAPPTLDDYEIRAEGYDNNGAPLSSPYRALPK